MIVDGYITLVETWGSDERIVESARMSTGKGFLGWGPKCKHCGWEQKPLGHYIGPCTAADAHETVPGDEKLLRHLWTSGHTSPFEQAGATFEVQAPIAVFREWHRHRTQSYNEHSARYSPLPAVDYIPTVERCMQRPVDAQSAALKGSTPLTEDTVRLWQSLLKDCYEQTEALYQFGLSNGIPKELARLCLTVGRHSRMRASANLLNWFRFLSKRLPSNAQQEIRWYAEELLKLLEPKFPRSAALFKETMHVG